jgi:hypothetical protein
MKPRRSTLLNIKTDAVFTESGLKDSSFTITSALVGGASRLRRTRLLSAAGAFSDFSFFRLMTEKSTSVSCGAYL